MGHGPGLAEMKAVRKTGKGAEETPADGPMGTGTPTGHIRWYRGRSQTLQHHFV